VEVQKGQRFLSEQENLRVADGISHVKNGEDDLAIECFTEAIRLNPGCARAYYLRAEIYSKNGKWAMAERDIAKARQAEARQQ